MRDPILGLGHKMRSNSSRNEIEKRGERCLPTPFHINIHSNQMLLRRGDDDPRFHLKTDYTFFPLCVIYSMDRRKGPCILLASHVSSCHWAMICGRKGSLARLSCFANRLEQLQVPSCYAFLCLFKNASRAAIAVDVLISIRLESFIIPTFFGWEFQIGLSFFILPSLLAFKKIAHQMKSYPSYSNC